MKDIRFTLLAFLGLLSLNTFAWNDNDKKAIPHLTTDIVEIGKVSPRTQIAGASGERYPDEYVMSLNGEWDFWWSESDATYKDEFISPQFNSGDWNKIQVPANWEVNGYGTYRIEIF